MINKRCSNCGETKAVSAFSPRAENPERLRSHCNQCISDYGKRYRNSVPDSRLSQRKARTAVEKGELEKPATCQGCGEMAELDKHHENYEEPLVVKWLCRKCHSKQHRAGIESCLPTFSTTTPQQGLMQEVG